MNMIKEEYIDALIQRDNFVNSKIATNDIDEFALKFKNALGIAVEEYQRKDEYGILPQFMTAYNRTFVRSLLENAGVETNDKEPLVKQILDYMIVHFENHPEDLENARDVIEEHTNDKIDEYLNNEMQEETYYRPQR